MAKRDPIPPSLRRAVMKRDGLTCQLCGKVGVPTEHYGPRVIEREPHFYHDYDGNRHVADVAFEFDHIVPVVKGGKTEADNLRLLCRRCNREKGARA